MAENQEKVQEIDDNLKDIMKNAKQNELTEDQIKKLIEENKDRFNFDKILSSIKLQMNKYVVFTDGKEQLIYEDGEFFVESVLDASLPRKKKKRSEARDMYLEYFIKYQINPFIKQKQLNNMVKHIYRNENVKANDLDVKEKSKVEDKKREIIIDKDSNEQDLKDKLQELKQKEERLKQNRKPSTIKRKKDIKKDEISK